MKLAMAVAMCIFCMGQNAAAIDYVRVKYSGKITYVFALDSQLKSGQGEFAQSKGRGYAKGIVGGERHKVGGSDKRDLNNPWDIKSISEDAIVLADKKSKTETKIAINLKNNKFKIDKRSGFANYAVDVMVGDLVRYASVADFKLRYRESHGHTQCEILPSESKLLCSLPLNISVFGI